MKKKKLFIALICMVIIGFLVVVYLLFFRKVEVSEPRLISDLYSKRLDEEHRMIYVKENGTYCGYHVIETSNYGDAVLLLRQYVYPHQMKYRDENMFGTGGAYYADSIVDKFLENEFYEFFSDGMKSMIQNTPIQIHSIDYVSKHFDEGPVFDVINRHVFVLSAPEFGVGSIGLDRSEDEAAFIPGITQYKTDKENWLRSEAIGGDDTWAIMVYNDGACYRHICNEAYVRPVFTVNPNEEIELCEIYDGQPIKRYVFVNDK